MNQYFIQESFLRKMFNFQQIIRLRRNLQKLYPIGMIIS